MLIITPKKSWGRIITLLAVTALLISAMSIAGCTAKSLSPAAKAADIRTPVGDIIKDPAEYEGKEVIVQGTITIECGSGCWFLLDDGTGVLYVTLSPNNFAIPQLQGSTVVVRGVVHVTNGDAALYGTSVATGSRVYP